MASAEINASHYWEVRLHRSRRKRLHGPNDRADRKSAGEIQNHADNGCRNFGQCAGQRDIAAHPFDERRAGVPIGAQQADELQHHDERTRRRLRHLEAIQQLARRKPVISRDRLLCDISEHRISSTERYHRHRREEGRDQRLLESCWCGAGTPLACFEMEVSSSHRSTPP